MLSLLYQLVIIDLNFKVIYQKLKSIEDKKMSQFRLYYLSYFKTREKYEK